MSALPQTVNPAQAQVWWDEHAVRFGSPLTGGEQRSHQWGAWRAAFTYDLLERDEAQPILAFLAKVAMHTEFTIYHPAKQTPLGAARNADAAAVKNTIVTASMTFSAAAGTITYASGTFLSQYAIGQYIVVTGTVSNNATYLITDLTNTVITVDATLVDETHSTTIEGLQAGRSLVTNGWPNSTLIFKAGDLFSLTNTGEAFEITDDVTSDGSGNATLNLAQYIRTSPSNGDVIKCEQVPIPVWLDQIPQPRWSTPTICSFDVSMVESL